MANRVLVVLEHFEKQLKPVSRELLTAASLLADGEPTSITAVLIGDGIESLGEAFAASSGFDLVGIQTIGCPSYHPETFISCLTELVEEMNFDCVCCAHSSQGSDFAPGLALQLNASCITAVEGIRIENEHPVYQRSVCGGKLVHDVTSTGLKTVLTIQPGSFEKWSNPKQTKGSVRWKSIPLKETAIDVRGVLPSEGADRGLSEARTVVGVGRGIGDQENLELISQLASILDKSAIAGSRPLCDLGWLHYRQQVGVTGATVSPDLYLACGISGASQHTMGMKESGLIISINTDPNAAIFAISDYCIVEDLSTLIPQILEVYDDLKSGMPG